MVSKWMEHGNINEFIEKEKDVNRTELVRHSSTLAHPKVWLTFCSVG
jgi:hypothetical protein